MLKWASEVTARGCCSWRGISGSPAGAPSQEDQVSWYIAALKKYAVWEINGDQWGQSRLIFNRL